MALQFGMSRTDCGCITGRVKLLHFLWHNQRSTVLLQYLRIQSEAHRLVQLTNIAQAQAKLPQLLLQSQYPTNKHDDLELHQGTAEATPCAAIWYQPTSFLTFLKGLKFLLAFCLGGSKRMEGSLSGSGAPILSSQCAGCCCRRATDCEAFLLILRWLHVVS